MTDAELELEMAETSFGYGRWNARCWFIGPEQGMSKDGSLARRVNTWVNFGKRDLDDCHAFHMAIKEWRWHGKPDGTIQPELQRTWKRCILVTLAYHDKSVTLSSALSSALDYQTQQWGSCSGDTCVIELSGIAAHSHKVKRIISPLLTSNRIKRIARRMREQEQKPEIVVLYGKGRNGSCQKAWQTLTEGATVDDEGLFKIARSVHSLLVWAPHPTAPITGNTDNAWLELGTRLRMLKQRAGNSLWEH
jgi:hypothetical protein